MISVKHSSTSRTEKQRVKKMRSREEEHLPIRAVGTSCKASQEQLSLADPGILYQRRSSPNKTPALVCHFLPLFYLLSPYRLSFTFSPLHLNFIKVITVNNSQLPTPTLKPSMYFIFYYEHQKNLHKINMSQACKNLSLYFGFSSSFLSQNCQLHDMIHNAAPLYSSLQPGAPTQSRLLKNQR